MKSRTKKQDAAALAGNNGLSLISNEKLLELYAFMLRGRMIAERARVLSGLNGITDMDEDGLGQEAAAVGVAIDLGAEDTVVPARGNLMPGFIKGVPLGDIFSLLIAAGSSPRTARRIQLPPAPARSAYAAWSVIDPLSSFAGSLDSAISAAQSAKTKKNGKIAVSFSGNGFASAPLRDEALALAREQRLPMLLVCSTSPGSDPESSPKSSPKSRKEQACGLPVIPVDGNDVVAVYRVATEAITHARKGNGPTLIECRLAQTGIDPAMPSDPILKMERYLARKGLFSKEMKRETAACFTQQLDAAIGAAIAAPSRRAPKRSSGR